MASLLLLSQLRFNAKIVILIKGVNHKSSGQILEPIFDTHVCLVVCFETFIIIIFNFLQIYGLQETQRNTPFFIEEKQFWNTSKQFKPQVSPSVQLHFHGINHWTMSFSSSKDEESIYYMDSLGAFRNNRIHMIVGFL